MAVAFMPERAFVGSNLRSGSIVSCGRWLCL